MLVSGIGCVHLNVSNLERAVYFYQEAFGFQVIDQQVLQTSLGTSSGIVLLVLHKVNNPPPRKVTTGLFHLAIRLPSREDLARLVYHLVNNSVDLEGVADHGVSESLYLTGPDGAGIELTCDRAEEDWPRDEEDQLDMGTEELDLDNLMMSLQHKEKKYKNLPNGTSIGHVHLAVKELALSEAFYTNLGLEVTQIYGEDALFFAGDDYHHHIGINTWHTAGAGPLPPDTAGLRFFELVYQSPQDLQTVLSGLSSAGIPVEEEEQGYMVIDPSGIKIMLSARSSFSREGLQTLPD